jgi:hypothetical protein
LKAYFSYSATLSFVTTAAGERGVREDARPAAAQSVGGKRRSIEPFDVALFDVALFELAP